MTVRVDVIVPVLEPGAVGAHSVALAELLRTHGVESDVWAREVRPELADRGGVLTRRPAGRAADVLVYQMAMGDDMADVVAGLPGRLVVNHHNLTPPSFFDRWEPALAAGLARGEAQLASMAGRAELAMAVSAFNAEGCRRAGYRHVEVAPFLADLDATGAADQAQVERLLDTKGGTDWLFVGRLCPNKAQHDLILAFAAFRRSCDPSARLFLVGGATPASYGAALRRLVADLGLEGSVLLTGPVPGPVLAAHYRAADVFVSLSDHEGFCVPVIEAWHAGLPVVALAAAAVPETVGGAGLLLPSKRSPAFTAMAVARVVGDAALRRRLVDAGRARLAERYAPPVARARTWQVLQGILDR
jgi:glycosyltransferase involved in cell wall biosynthesis